MTRSAANGKPGLGRIGRGNMAFHIDRLRHRFPNAARPCRSVAATTSFDAGEAAADHAPAAQRALDAIIASFSARPARKRASPARTSVATTTSPDFSDGSSPPATPNEMTPLKVAGIKRRQQRAQLLRVAGTADNDHAGPGRDAGLLHQSRYDQDRPRIIRIAINRTGHDRSGPRPQSHIPTPTTLLLVLRKFRYRASAQSGKNFE